MTCIEAAGHGLLIAEFYIPNVLVLPLMADSLNNAFKTYKRRTAAKKYGIQSFGEYTVLKVWEELVRKRGTWIKWFDTNIKQFID